MKNGRWDFSIGRMRRFMARKHLLGTDEIHMLYSPYQWYIHVYIYILYERVQNILRIIRGPTVDRFCIVGAHLYLSRTSSTWHVIFWTISTRNKTGYVMYFDGSFTRRIVNGRFRPRPQGEGVVLARSISVNKNNRKGDLKEGRDTSRFKQTPTLTNDSQTL